MNYVFTADGEPDQASLKSAATDSNLLAVEESDDEKAESEFMVVEAFGSME